MTGQILTELHGRLVGLDEAGNLILAGTGIVGGGVPAVLAKGAPSTVAITAAAGTSNISNVTFQLQDKDGASVARVTDLDIHLSDAATGIGLTATTPSGGIAAGASGAIMGVHTTSKALRVQTDATGKFILAITDSAKTGFYPCATRDGAAVKVGAQLVTASYG